MDFDKDFDPCGHVITLADGSKVNVHVVLGKGNAKVLLYMYDINGCHS